MWTQYGLIAIGGAIGAMTRFAVGSYVQERMGNPNFPWGTFIINITGSFLLGFIMTLLAERILISPNWRPLVTIGFIGAYTTFSTYEYETAKLGSSGHAMMNMIGSVMLGYAAVWLGIGLANILTSGITSVFGHRAS